MRNRCLEKAKKRRGRAWGIGGRIRPGQPETSRRTAADADGMGLGGRVCRRRQIREPRLSAAARPRPTLFGQRVPERPRAVISLDEAVFIQFFHQA